MFETYDEFRIAYESYRKKVAELFNLYFQAETGEERGFFHHDIEMNFEFDGVDCKAYWYPAKDGMLSPYYAIVPAVALDEETSEEIIASLVQEIAIHRENLRRAKEACKQRYEAEQRELRRQQYEELKKEFEE